MRTFISVLFALSIFCSFSNLDSYAGQIKIKNYADAQKDFFFGSLYKNGGHTLYCGKKFKTSADVVAEKIFASAWMIKKFGCTSEGQCRKESKAFNFAEADLHNLYPVRADVSLVRKDFVFGNVPGEDRPFPGCNFEYDTKKRIVEPRRISRGNIARAIFYMYREYGFEIPERMGPLLVRWNRSDPPSAAEKWRNDAIERIQGNRNPFVDNPALADSLPWSRRQSIALLERSLPAAQPKKVHRPKTAAPEPAEKAADETRRKTTLGRTRSMAQSTGRPTPKEVTVARFPTMEAPKTVAPGAVFPLQVWLTEDMITPGVKVATGGKAHMTSEGKLSMSLPDNDEGLWKLRVVLTAPGFQLVAGSVSQMLDLPREGDSTPVLFMLAAKDIGMAAKRKKIRVTLWHDGIYIASISRKILVTADPAIAALEEKSEQPKRTVAKKSEPTAGRRKPMVVTQAKERLPVDDRLIPPDLTVHILYDDPDKLGRGQVIIASPHFNPPSRLLISKINTPNISEDWIHYNYQQFTYQLASFMKGKPKGRLKDFTIPMLQGFGRELYRRFAPEEFKRVFWNLHDRGKLKSIQIFSNNPILPWELMRPYHDEASSKSALGETDFLGISFEVARWEANDGGGQLDRPPQAMRYEGISAVAPRYDGKQYLPFQAKEMARLEKFRGFSNIGGRFSDIKKLITNGPHGIVHFTGHGIIDSSPKGLPWYEIQLEDASLDVLTWRGLVARSHRTYPFYFLNACDLGQARSVANFVEGWAPAVLSQGASGYIGGLWPLADGSAAQFSNRFYTELTRGLRKGKSQTVSNALQKARTLFYKTGDPTYLAYTYFGDVNLRFYQ